MTTQHINETKLSCGERGRKRLRVERLKANNFSPISGIVVGKRFIETIPARGTRCGELNLRPLQKPPRIAQECLRHDCRPVRETAADRSPRHDRRRGGGKTPGLIPF